MRKKLLVLISLIIVILLVIGLSKAPLLSASMTYKEYDNFIFYYESKDGPIIDTLNSVLEEKYQIILDALVFKKAAKTEVYIYPDIKSFQAAARGRVVPLLNQQWFIGDNRGAKILLVSPLNPGEIHDSESVIQAAVHEYSHTIVQSISKNTPKYLDEGLAMYFAGQTVNYSFIESEKNIPNEDKLFTMKNNSINSLRFGTSNGYPYSFTYVDFLINTYGLNKVKDLIRESNKIEQVLGEASTVVYEKWIEHLRGNYMSK